MVARWISWAAARYALVVALLTWGVAIMLYPGGTVLDESTHGYSFTHNFLSDLGSTVAFNYTRNLAGAVLFAAGILIGASVLAHVRRHNPFAINGAACAPVRAACRRSWRVRVPRIPRRGVNSARSGVSPSYRVEHRCGPLVPDCGAVVGHRHRPRPAISSARNDRLDDTHTRSRGVHCRGPPGPEVVDGARADDTGDRAKSYGGHSARRPVARGS
jgi:hypothetical protein